MIRFLIRRIFQGAIVMVLVTIGIYVLFFAGSPHNVARQLAGRQATQAQVDHVYHNLGLDRPILVQYWHFLLKLLHGNLGTSYYHGQQVTTVIKQDVPVTFSLVMGAAVLWLIFGVATGVYSAVHPRSLADRLITAFALFFYSLPVFVLGLTLIYFLFFKLTTSLHLSWFPAGNYASLSDNPWQWFRHLILPWIALALISAAAYTRLSRTSMLEVLGEDYIRTARAKGLTEWRVILRHALRSALTPVVTQFGVDVAVALGGAVLTESVFGLPGLGREAVSAISNQDLPVIIGIVIVAAAAVVIANIVVDILYAVLDPRVKLH